MTPGSSVIQEWAQAIALPRPLRTDEWADEHVRLPETSAARGGRYRTETVPYLAEVMNALQLPGVKKVAVMKGHQIGVSTALDNMIAATIANDPSAVLMVHPTRSAAEAWTKERLDPMIESTPALRSVVQTKRGVSGRPESTLGLKLYPGGFVAIVGANSPNAFARWSVRYAFGDDVDRWPPVVGDEGDPGELLVNRTTSFDDGVTVFVSTPTLKYERIDSLYQQSDRRRFFTPCPSCGRSDFITWSDLAHLHRLRGP